MVVVWRKNNTQDFLLERFNLDYATLTQPASTLSSGEKQRVSMLRALLLQKQLIFFDEATSALDKKTELKIADYFLNHVDATIFWITHSKDYLKYFTHHLVVSNGFVHLEEITS